jgi:hypothetical protein
MLSVSGDITEMLEIAAKLQKHGTMKNIVSIFDDGGYRELLMGELFGLLLHKGRHGDDATDDKGRNYELKTVNLVDTSGNLRKNPGVTTCHHVNYEIINRYRGLHAWVVGVFFINEPVEIYELEPKFIEELLDKWENRLKNENISHINNPKIKLQDIRKHGTLHYINKPLSAKYIEGGLPKGLPVFTDILDLTHRPTISEATV